MTQTIYGGKVGSELLPAGHVLTVTLDAGAGAQVQRIYGGSVVEAASLAGSTSYGPYLHDMQFRVSALAGATVTVDSAPNTAANLNATQTAAAAALVSKAGNSLPVVLIGGDHPYIQWYGTNGKDGLAAAYLNRGIRPYLAINTDSDAVQNPGQEGYCTWAQIRELRDMGVEITSHAVRHPQNWTKLNTGLKIQYSGAAATATVHVASGSIVGTTAGAVADFSITLAGKTLSVVADEIAAVSGWTCTLAPELTGAESATKILDLPVGGAKSAKSPSVARIAAGGGIIVRYTGTALKTARVTVTGTTMRLHGDGAPILSMGLTSGTYDTLNEVVAAINAVSGWTASLCDNDNSVDATSDNYISGAETSAFFSSDDCDCIARETVIELGLTRAYIRRRLLRGAVETAAANGIELKCFCQCGNSFFSDLIAGDTTHDVYRGNARYGYAPFAIDSAAFSNFVTHNSYKTQSGFDSAEKLVAAVRAHAASGPRVMNILIHGVVPDGASGLSLLPVPGSGNGDDQTEANLVALLDELASLRAAGKIINAHHADLKRITGGAAWPWNMLFNSGLVSSGETMTGLGSNSDGKIIPGWRFAAPAQVTACAVVDGALQLTSNATTVFYPLRQIVQLMPGRTYDIGINFDRVGAITGNGVKVFMTPLGGRVRGMVPGQTAAESIRRADDGVVGFRYTVPVDSPVPPLLRSIAEPFDLATPKNIRINLDGKGLTSDIDCSGVTPGATTAKEVAAKINLALAADSRYPAEYHNAARAENGYVVIESPWPVGGSITSFRALADQGSTNDAFLTIFGTAGTNDGVGYKVGSLEPRYYEFTVQVEVSGSLSLYDPWIQAV